MAVAGDQGSRFDVVKTAADRWADDLVDLTSRNGLVYFKESKTATLDLTAADPRALSRFMSGQKVRLGHLYSDAEQHGKACTKARNLRRKIVEFDEEQGVAVGHVASGLLVVDAPKVRSTVPMPALKAPLLLRSVEIHARTAGETDFTLELQADPEPNPVLLYVLDRTRGLSVDDELLAEIRQAIADQEDPSAQAKQMFRVLADALGRAGVEARFEERIIAGVFSFEKMPMVNDLRDSTDLLAGHDVIAAVAGHAAAAAALTQTSGRSMPQPDEQAPTDELIVLDADSSQQAAIAAALSGQHVVIDGPPGTGKSQTIANVIACLASAGRRVLFVSEKRAAIEAVTQRLEEVDLDHLVFDLHDQRINRKYVASQLTQSLDRASGQAAPRLDELHETLIRRRDDVRRYAADLHREHAPWEISFYQALSQLNALPQESARAVRLRGSTLLALDARKLREAEERLKDLVDKGGLDIRRGGSIWSRSDVRSEAEVQKALAELDELAASTLRDASRDLDDLILATGLRRPDAVGEWQQIFDLLSDVERSVSDFGAEVFGNDLEDLISATADRAWRRANAESMPFWRRWLLVRKARTMRGDGVRERRALHHGLVAAARQRDRWRELSEADATPGTVPGLARAAGKYSNLRNQLAAVAACAQLDDLISQPTEDIRTTLSQLDAERNILYLMPEINSLTAWLTDRGLADVLDELAAGPVNAVDAALLLRRVWLASLIDELRSRTPGLSRFVGRQHTRVVAEFATADKAHIRANADRIRREVAVRLQHARDRNPEQDSFVRRQAALRARHAPVRKLVEKAPDVLLALHPCWAMSPLVVSRMLPAQRLFDTVVFDEASQVQPHDAVAAIMRGRQLIVAGDDKQLPPTNFFKRSLTVDTEDDPDEDYDLDLNLYKSILDRVKSMLSQRHRLRWHYRSLDERLIAFSNTQIYAGELVTFPGTGVEPPITVEVVDGRAMPGQDGSAPEEVQRVVELAVQHAEQRPSESLGVITLSQKHASRVEAALMSALRERPDLAEFFSDELSASRRFFVKNLERVQGDERETIILSLGYAKNAAGKVTMNFGPLTHEGGERRLNVAITRARRRMIVVSSFSHLEMPPSVANATHRGPELLRLFLEFAHRHGQSDLSSRSRDVELNGFEQSVYEAVKAAGVAVYPQWGVSDYRIDFALAHPQRPGQMVLALETDGASYHKAASARDRDRLRQGQLERLGWRFHRIWSMDWYQNQDEEVRRIVAAWQEASALADAPPTFTTERKAVLPTRAGPRHREIAEAARGARPAIATKARSADYSDTELDKICRWLLCDGLPMARADRLEQAIAELGVSRRGKILERLGGAFDRAERLMAREGNN